MSQSMGGTLQARPQEPPEVYSNLLSPSVGETTGGKHPYYPFSHVGTVFVGEKTNRMLYEKDILYIISDVARHRNGKGK